MFINKSKALVKAYIVIGVFLSFLIISLNLSYFSKQNSESFISRVKNSFKRTKYFGLKVIDTNKKNKKFKSNLILDKNDVLNSFYKKLYKLENKKYDKNVKILFYGTSSIGFDRVTAQMRKRLQKRFSDGGKGFIPISKGWRYHRHKDINWEFSENWKTHSITYHEKMKHDHGRYGLGGVLSYNTGPAYVKYTTVGYKKNKQKANEIKKNSNNNNDEYIAGTKFSKFTLYYQAYPAGPTLSIIVDGITHRLDTYSKTVEDKYFELELEDKAHEIIISSNKAGAKLYGVSFDRNIGVIVDALMLVGAFIKQLHFFDKNHIASMIKKRNPDLLVYNFGANEAFYNPEDKKINKIINNYVNAINFMKSKTPNTPCLIVSIKDLGIKIRNKIITRPGVEKMLEANKIVAKRANCSFINLFKLMGGKNSVRKWRMSKPKLVSKDLGHLFNPGAIKIGNLITSAIINDYEDFLED